MVMDANGNTIKLLRQDRDWRDYPLGTKAHAFNGGYWIRVEGGWKASCSHCVFPTPGGDACGACIELPSNDNNNP